MPITQTSLARDRNDITAAMLTALQSAVPDLYTGDDGVVYILFTVESAQLENAFLANQLLLEDVFPQTSSAAALDRHGETFGLALKQGEAAIGEATFEGDASTVIASGTRVGADPGNNLPIVEFQTIEDATIPNPGDPEPPSAAINVAAGNLNGTYEYEITFVTADGETLPSDPSNPVSPVNQQVNISVISLGNPNVIARNIYRQKDGIGAFQLVATIFDNTTTTYTDNTADISASAPAPTSATALQVTAEATAVNAGTDGNVAPGMINTLLDVVGGITSVTNENAFLGGSNPESSEVFRMRLLEYLRNPRSGSAADLKFWAESVRGVEEATVFTNDDLGTSRNGYATVRISGPAGAIPGDEVIDEVQALLDSKDLANITIRVATFTAVGLSISVDVTTSSDYTLGEVTANVQDSISDYIHTVPVGGTAYLSGVVDAVFGLPGVIDVVVTSPTSNQIAGVTQKFVPGTITVT